MRRGIRSRAAAPAVSNGLAAAGRWACIVPSHALSCSPRTPATPAQQHLVVRPAAARLLVGGGAGATAGAAAPGGRGCSLPPVWGPGGLESQSVSGVPASRYGCMAAGQHLSLYLHSHAPPLLPMHPPPTWLRCSVYLASPDGAALVRELSFEVQPGRRCGWAAGVGAVLAPVPCWNLAGQAAAAPVLWAASCPCHCCLCSHCQCDARSASPGLLASPPPPPFAAHPCAPGCTVPAPQRAHHGPQRQRQEQPVPSGGGAVAPAGTHAAQRCCPASLHTCLWTVHVGLLGRGVLLADRRCPTDTPGSLACHAALCRRAR